MWPVVDGPASSESALWGSVGGYQVESPEFEGLKAFSSLAC